MSKNGSKIVPINKNYNQDYEQYLESQGFEPLTEHAEQFMLVKWLRQKGICHHHSPNSIKSTPREGAKYKRLGTRAGFPDLVIPYARRSYHGLYIELKRASGGVLSDCQKWWATHLLNEGYKWEVCYGCAHAQQVICQYMDIERTINV